jgi:hypothetical protein
MRREALVGPLVGFHAGFTLHGYLPWFAGT